MVTESAAAGSTETQLTLNASAQEIPDASSINLSATLTAAQQGVSAGSIALYINRQPYKTPQTPGSGGIVSWNGIAVTKENGFTTGANRLTAVYSGTDTYAPAQEEITITVTRTGMFEISEQNGKVDVAFTNLSGKEMRNALLMIGVYRNGSLQKTAVAADGVTINQGETQSFRFDMSGMRFDRIQGFIWDSPQTMTPLAKNAVVLLDE